MSNPQQLVQKLWNYCNILRDDGLSYGEIHFKQRHRQHQKLVKPEK